MEINISTVRMTPIKIFDGWTRGITHKRDFALRAVRVFVNVPINSKFEFQGMKFFYFFAEETCI